MNNKRTLTGGYGSKLVALFLISSLALTSVSSSIAAPPPPEDVVFETITLPPEAQSAPDGLTAKSRTSGNPKLDSTMAGLAAAAHTSTQEAIELARSQALMLSGNRVHVQVVTHAPGLENAIEAMTEAGGEVTGVGNDDTLIQGWLPVDALETVAAQDDVYFLRRPAEVQLFENLLAGNSTTEGLAVINGPAWHAAGYTGSGVKVAIIDGGFIGYADLLGVDLPASVTVKNFVDGEDDSQVNGTTEHGTACAEIVHDIVPGASLYLAKVGTNLDLAEAVAWAKDTHQVDIISTSLGWYNLTPGDGSGEFADLVQSARNAGILWATAASNDREAHWGGPYSDPNSNGYHNFTADQEINYFGPGDGAAYSINPGFMFPVYMRWDDWTNVNQDYNLYVVRWNGASWDTIASSTRTQNGGPGQTPTESTLGITSGTATAYGFVIERVSSTRNVNFEIFVPKFLRPDELLHARSLSNLADAPDAMTVAALDVTSPYPQESYSSEGPTNGPGGAETGGFTKPDISGFANVATESYPDSTFNGTSSATPHVAGAAALVLSAYPSYTPDQLQSFLEGRAIDMGTAGMDTLYGYGRLYLGDPPGGANTAPTISGLPDQSLLANTSRDNAIDLWNYASDAEDADADLTFSIVNSPDPDAGVSIDSDRYIDINPAAGWTGQTDVEIQVQDTGGLTGSDTFRVTVSAAADKTWNGSVSNDWHTADNWTPAGVPDSGDDVLIPNVTNDPVISAGEAQVDGLTIDAGAVLDLTDRTLTVEGALTNNGTLKQTQGVAQGSGTEFLRITNQAGNQTQYYGVDITPAGAAFAMHDLVVKRLPILSEPFALQVNDLVHPAAPLADVELIVDDGTQEDGLVLRDPDTLMEFHAVLFNHYTATMVSSFPFTLERIDIHENTNNLQGEEIQLLVYTDASGGDPSDATLLYSEIVTVQNQLGWNVYTMTTPVVIPSSTDILLGFSTYYADGGVSWPYQDRYPYPMDETDPQGGSYLAWMGETYDPVDPSDLSGFTNLIEMGDIGYPCNWLVRGYGSTVTANTPPILSNLPDQTVPMNGSADNAIDLWAYASDAEDADADLTFTIVNSPNANAGVTVDSDRYIDINPVAGWTGQTDVEVQVQDTGGLTDTDTFQVTVTGGSDPDIEVSPASFEETVKPAEVLTRTLTISNTGGADLIFLVSESVAWLSETPGSGTVPAGGAQSVDVIFNAAGLAMGDYTTDLTIVSNDPDENPVTVPITMHVTDNAPPVLAGIPDQVVIPGSAYFPLDLWPYTSDAESPDDALTFVIDNTPAPNAGVSIESNRYVNISPTPGWTGQTTVVVRVTDPGGLSDTDAFLVTVGQFADIEVTPTVFDESVPQDETLVRTLTISNTGVDDLIFVIGDGGVAWLSQDPVAGAVAGGAAQPVAVTFDATGLAEGDYSTALTITNNDPDENPVTIPVTMHVTATGELANVTVSISGHQLCAGRTAGVERCFDLDSSAPLSAAVRFYFSEGERNGQTLNDLLVFHYDGDWIEEPGPYTRGGAGDAQYVEAQNVDDFSLFALGKSGPTAVYLPLVIRRWPPLPYTPVLNAISNDDGDGSYTVSWNAALLANTYTLQEDDNAAFSSPTTAYGPGAGTSTAISGKPVGTYYYRVKATNNYGDSSWSNVQTVIVQPPDTPTLNAISNADGDGNYTVSWNAAARAQTYTLQEDEDPAFGSPTTQYTGAGTSWSAASHAAGTYYYRVIASNAVGYSGWSNVQSVRVTPPSIFYATTDTSVLQGVPGTSFGSLTRMRVGYDMSGCPDSVNGQISRGLIKFDLTAIPAGTSIVGARLYLNLVGTCYYQGHTQARTVTLYRNTGDWASTTTWNTKPAYAEASGSAAVSVSSGGWKSFDVTAAVRNWINGSRPNYGFTVRGPETSGSEFARLEFATLNWSGTSYDPYLQITYAGMAASDADTPASEGSPNLAASGPTFRDVLGISLDPLAAPSLCPLSRQCTLPLED